MAKFILIYLLLLCMPPRILGVRRVLWLGEEGDWKLADEANGRQHYERGGEGAVNDWSDASDDGNGFTSVEEDHALRRRLSSPPSFESYEVTDLSGLDSAAFPTKHYAGHIPTKVGEFSESYGNQIFSWLFHPAAPDGTPIAGASEPGLAGKKVRGRRRRRRRQPHAYPSSCPYTFSRRSPCSSG